MKASPHIRSSISDEGVIFLDIRSGQFFSANAIAARIWRGLEQDLPMETIVARIASETGAEPAVVERDATEFVSLLASRGLVESPPENER